MLPCGSGLEKVLLALGHLRLRKQITVSVEVVASLGDCEPKGREALDKQPTAVLGELRQECALELVPEGIKDIMFYPFSKFMQPCDLGQASQHPLGGPE